MSKTLIEKLKVVRWFLREEAGDPLGLSLRAFAMAKIADVVQEAIEELENQAEVIEELENHVEAIEELENQALESEEEASHHGE